jgi:uncharacterized membrane protein (DUF2068 family)
MLALMNALVGLLGLMFSLSLVLRAQIYESYEGLYLLAGGMAAFGALYLVLAYGLWMLRRWFRMFAIISLPVMAIGSLLNMQGNKVMVLGTVLIFFLAFVTHLAAIVGVHKAETRSLFVN